MNGAGVHRKMGAPAKLAAFLFVKIKKGFPSLIYVIWKKKVYFKIDTVLDWYR